MRATRWTRSSLLEGDLPLVVDLLELDVLLLVVLVLHGDGGGLLVVGDLGVLDVDLGVLGDLIGEGVLVLLEEGRAVLALLELLELVDDLGVEGFADGLVVLVRDGLAEGVHRLLGPVVGPAGGQAEGKAGGGDERGDLLHEWSPPWVALRDPLRAAPGQLYGPPHRGAMGSPTQWSVELPGPLGQAEPEAVDGRGPLRGAGRLRSPGGDVEGRPVLGARVRLVPGRRDLEHPLQGVQV